MGEAELEAWARRGVYNAGGLMLKWVSPGCRGVPDDIIFWPDGTLHFAEFKFKSGVTDAHQARMHNRLAELGQTVYVFSTEEQVTRYIKDFQEKQ